MTSHIIKDISNFCTAGLWKSPRSNRSYCLCFLILYLKQLFELLMICKWNKF